MKNCFGVNVKGRNEGLPMFWKEETRMTNLKAFQIITWTLMWKMIWV